MDISFKPAPSLGLSLRVEPHKSRLLWDRRYLYLMGQRMLFIMDGADKVAEFT